MQLSLMRRRFLALTPALAAIALTGCVSSTSAGTAPSSQVNALAIAFPSVDAPRPATASDLVDVWHAPGWEDVTIFVENEDTGALGVGAASVPGVRPGCFRGSFTLNSDGTVGAWRNPEDVNDLNSCAYRGLPTISFADVTHAAVDADGDPWIRLTDGTTIELLRGVTPEQPLADVFPGANRPKPVARYGQIVGKWGEVGSDSYPVTFEMSDGVHFGGPATAIDLDVSTRSDCNGAFGGGRIIGSTTAGFSLVYTTMGCPEDVDYPGTLPLGFVNRVAFDRDGHLWLATTTGGTYKLTRVTSLSGTS